MTPSASAWCYADDEDRAWWGSLWADRATKSAFGEQATGHGFADVVALERISIAWRRWSAEPDGWFAILNGEILSRV